MIIKVNELALEQLHKIPNGLFITMTTKGCYGYSYIYKPMLPEYEATSIKIHDLIHISESLYEFIRDYVNTLDYIYTLDYVKTNFTQGFKLSSVLETGQCGCGASFSQ